VQVKDIEQIPKLGSAGESKDLVRGQVRQVKGVPKIRVRLHRKEAKGRVGTPLQLEGIGPPGRLGPVIARFANLPLKPRSRLYQYLGVGVGADGDAPAAS